MLFNLTTRYTVKCVKHEWAIECTKNKGPRFGVSELTAVYQPFNQDNTCWSNANVGGYRIGMDSESRSMLTNLKCKKDEHGLMKSEFTITELEVWEIIFIK
jgi:hypothetical protein